MTKNEYSLSAAKNDLLSFLLLTLVPLIYDGIINIYTEAVKEQNKLNTFYYTKQFQQYLRDVKNWNSSIIQMETERIKEILHKNHNYNLRSLLTMIIVLQFRIFSAIRTGGPKEEVSIDAPKEEEFIHKLYVSVARNIYDSREILDSMNNYKDTEIKNKLYDLINRNITDILSSYVPISTILDVYLGNMFTESKKDKYAYKNGKYVSLEPEPEPESDTDSEPDQDPGQEQRNILNDAWPENKEIGSSPDQVLDQNQIQDSIQELPVDVESLFKSNSLEIDNMNANKMLENLDKSLETVSNIEPNLNTLDTLDTIDTLDNLGSIKDLEPEPETVPVLENIEEFGTVNPVSIDFSGSGNDNDNEYF